MKLGQAELGPVSGQVHHKWGLNAGPGSGPAVLANGAIGLAALFPRNIEFDFHDGTLTLFEPGETRERAKDGPWVRIPFEYDDRGIVLTLSIDGVPAKFALDSPATASMVRIDSPIFGHTKLPCELDSVQDNFCGFAVFDQVRSGSDVLDSFRAVVVTMGPVPFDGVLGVDFFQSHRIFVNFSDGFVYIQSVIPNRP